MPSPLPRMNPYLEAPSVRHDFPKDFFPAARERLAGQVRVRLPALLLLLPALLLAAGCRPSATALPPATPGLELQDDDYARVRQQFRTRLVRRGPTPQQWDPIGPPPQGADAVGYVSGPRHLAAWISRPPAGGARRPAVLFLHGGWAFGADDWDMAAPFRDAGFVVMTPVLRGENGQPGDFSMFYDEVDDVLAAADFLASRPHVDPARLFVAGHSAGGTLTMLAAQASPRFQAAAALSGSPDRVDFVRGGWAAATPFDQADLREFQVRSPVAYATSFKCPARLYVGSREPAYQASTRRTAMLAQARGLDVQAVIIPGDHFSAVPEALRQAVQFFRQAPAAPPGRAAGVS